LNKVLKAKGRIAAGGLWLIFNEGDNDFTFPLHVVLKTMNKLLKIKNVANITIKSGKKCYNTSNRLFPGGIHD
jgi:hypothetical protein